MKARLAGPIKPWIDFLKQYMLYPEPPNLYLFQPSAPKPVNPTS